MRAANGLCLFLVLFYIKDTFGQDYFNPQFLGSDVASIEDLSYITSGSQLSPGNYYLYLYSGEQFLKNIKINFSSINGVVQPCFTHEVVNAIPFNEDVKKKLKNILTDKDTCVDIGKFIKEFDYEVDLAKLTLRLSIPQIYLDSTLTTMAPESEWDDGITAFIMNYDYNGSYSKNNNSQDYSSNYLFLRNRANIGPWRLNANVYYNEYKSGPVSNHDINTNGIFASRKIDGLKSELLVGQSTIGSSLFDANSYKGITLATSDEMLPDSDRGYSPSIRGIAESRSKLTVKQNGSIIYQTYVNPGPYNINNLNSVGTSGDYEVELTSAEGVVQTFAVPYSSLPNLLRRGKYNYALTLGKLDLNSANDTNFLQTTIAIGVPYESTIFVGSQLSADYKSVGLGMGKDFGGLGALSVDALHASTRINEEAFSGESYRALYSKSFNDTGTNLQLTGYRYSTSDYYSLSEASRKQDYSADGFDNYYYGRRKDSFQLNISQSLNDYGQIFVWGNVSSYWGSDMKSKNIQFGWNKNFSQLNNIMLSVNYNKKTYGTMTDDIFYFSLSMPLSTSSSQNSMYVSNSSTYSQTDYSNATSLYGNMSDGRVNYNIYQSLNKNSGYNNSSANLSYKANSAEMRAGILYSDQSRQVDYGINGGMLLSQDGVILTREANDTAILVEAKGANGARVSRAGENISINKNGYALIPYATPYHYNDIELDPSSFSNNYDVDNKIRKSAPTRGAIAKVTFQVKKGYSFLVNLKKKNKPVKFGTLVKNTKYNTVSIADDDGTVFLTGVENNTPYTVSWDDNTLCHFTVSYDETKMKTVNKIDADCI